MSARSWQGKEKRQDGHSGIVWSPGYLKDCSVFVDLEEVWNAVFLLQSSCTIFILCDFSLYLL